VGICAVLKSIEPKRLLEFKVDATGLHDYLEADDDRLIDLDKSWHGIHYLLTGAAGPTSELLGCVIMGGMEIGEDLGMGPPRYLEASDVRKIASALTNMSDEILRARFDPQKMDVLDIYPTIWARDGEEGFDYLRDFFCDLVRGYVEAADRGDAMLIMMG
jgi:hypothetical protein